MLRPLRPRDLTLVTLCLFLTLSGALVGCNRLLDRLGDALYPSPTPGASLAETAVEPPPEVQPMTETVASDPTHTPAVLPAPPVLPTTAPQPSATPAPGSDYALVYARSTSLFRGDYVGGAAVEAAIVPQLENWAYRDGILATTQGRAIELIDLNAGRLRSLQVDTPSDIDYAEVLWGSSGRALLHVAWLADAGEGAGRAVELHALSAEDGAWMGVLRLEVAGGLRALRYDDVAERVTLILYDVDGAFDAVTTWSLADGARPSVLAVQGTGDAVISPDGARLLVQQRAEGGSRLVLYDSQSGDALQTWDQPDQHSVEHIWAPDGSRIACLLRSGADASDPESQGLGMWVLDARSGERRLVVEEPSVAASLVSWSPTGDDILGYHRGESGDAFAYVIRADGSNRRILSLPENARVIGWMPTPGADSVPQIVVDPWRARFIDAAGDSQATANLVAEIVGVQSEVDDAALLSQVTGYLREAGWSLGEPGPSLKRIDTSTFVMQLPPANVYVIQPHRAQVVASGHMVLDARLVGDDLGLVYGVLWDGNVQPAFVLLRRNAEGLWQTLWLPQGQRDWIATDGEIVLAGEGLDLVRVSGSSFGLDEEGGAFGECRACPHRQFVADWERRDDAYVRRSSLPADAPLSAVLWEMTSPTPYGVLYEAVRRLRSGEPLEDLADAAVIAQMRTAGLDQAATRLLAEEERADVVRFAVAESAVRYVATVQDGRVTALEAAP